LIFWSITLGTVFFGPIIEIDLDGVRKLYETNLFGLLSVTQIVSPHMIKQGSGLIVNVSSVASFISTALSGVYSASKAAVNSVSDCLRIELKPFGIDVVVIIPGAIETKFSANSKRGETGVPLKPDSLYTSIAHLLKNGTTQGSRTPVEEFSAQTVNYILTVANKGWWVRLFGFEPYFYCGKYSTIGPVLKRWLPTWLSDRLVSSRAGLNQLKLKQKNE